MPDDTIIAGGTEAAVLNYERPNPELLMRAAGARLALARDFAVTSDASLALAGEELQAIVTAKRNLEEKRLAITRPIDAAKRAVMDLFRPAVETLEQAERLLKTSIGNYQAEQRRIADERRRIAEAAAAAERARLQAEAAAQAEAARKAAAAGDTEAAQQRAASAAVIAQTATTVVAAPVAAPTKAVGITSRQQWKARVTDKAAFVAHVAANPALLHLLDVSESGLNAMARAQQNLLALPGVEPYPENVVSARRAA